MLLPFAGLILAQFAQPSDNLETLRIEGRCTYSPALIEEADGAVLLQCGEARLSATGIAFAARGFDPTVRFAGSWDGDALTVTQVARRGYDEAESARGFCRVETREQEIAAVVCSVVAGPRSYLANFIVPRL